MERREWTQSKLIGLGIFLLAFLPRLASLNRYVTLDELAWVLRSIRFRDAWLAQDWASTIQTGHPGVTTTWLGGIGVQLTLWLRPETAVHLDWIRPTDWFSPLYAAPLQQVAPFLSLGRLGVMVTTSLAIVAAYWLLRRIVPPIPALTATLALVFAPFYTGLSGMLHTDALLASLTIGTFLLLIPQATPRRSLLAGLATAAAVVTKLPGLLLVGLVPLILLSQTGRQRDWRRLLHLLLWWGIPFLIGLVVLLPGIVAAPFEVLAVLSSSAGDTISETYTILFLGAYRSDSPPVLFYPLAFFLRLAPGAMIGMVLGLISLRQQEKVAALQKPFSWLTSGGKALTPKAWLQLFGFWFLLFSFLFVAGLSVSARVFARYLLPVVMVWTLWGGLAIGFWLERQTGKRQRQTAVLTFAIFASFSLVHLSYPLFAYNWLLGGQRASGYLMKTGFQETHSVATRWLVDQGVTGTIYTDNVPAVAPFYDEEIVFFNERTAVNLRPTDWLILPLDEFIPSAPADPLLATIQTRFTPQERIRVGTRQVGVYTGISSSDLGLTAVATTAHGERFGEALLLNAAGGTAVDNNITTVLTWQVVTPANYRLALSVEDDVRHTWFRNEFELANQIGYPSRQWEAEQNHVVHYNLPLPVDVVPGDYHVYAQLFDESGAQQGVFDAASNFVGNRVQVAKVRVTQPTPQPSVAIPNEQQGAGELLGFSNVPTEMGAGEAVTIDLWWRQGTETADSGNLLLQLGPETIAVPLETADWVPGNVLHLRPTWTIPPTFPVGNYDVAIQWRTETGDVWSQSLGQLTVEARDRDYDLPPSVTEPLGVQFDTLAKLHAAETTVGANGATTLQLVWQADSVTEQNFTTFVHLRDEAGNIVAQQDRTPVVPTSAWAPGQVIVDAFVFEETAVSISVGLYDSNTGQRLPVFAPDGTPVPDAQYHFQIE